MSVKDIGRVQVFAPISGIIRSLDQIPDAAFAGRMLGDGVAIDPLEEVLRAPFDGTITSVATTSHALTLRSVDGLELLLHVGIDTVSLNGEGFTMLVESGQRVVQGDALLQFDADKIGIPAPSLMTPIIVTNGGSVLSIDHPQGRIETGAPLFSAALPEADAAAANSATGGHPTHGLRVELSLPHGFHARPSARVAEVAKTFAGSISFTCQGRTADATSMTQLMALGAIKGSVIDISASGAGAQEIVKELAALLDRLGASEAKAVEPAAAARTAAPLPPSALSVTQVAGVCAASGLAVGVVAQLRLAAPDVPERCDDPITEERLLREAVKRLTSEIEAQIAAAGAVAADIGRAHLAILQDPTLIAAAESHIGDGLSAGSAWRQASRAQEAALSASESPRVRERAVDFRDVERRLLFSLYGGEQPSAPPQGAVVICDDIAPSFLVDMPRDHISGICTASGGATSHAAILAAALGIPMLVAAGGTVLEIPEETTVILDAGRGYLDRAPTVEAIEAARSRMAANEAASAAARALAADECHLADGTRIEVFANLASAPDAAHAVSMGAEGCGLLRTEFIFAETEAPPSEDAQAAIYSDIAGALGDRPLIVRTLDIGGDKPLEYLPFPAEPNPALGMRGIRFSLKERELLQTQLRAILRSVPASQLRIMVPMVVELSELDAVRAYVDETRQELAIGEHIPVGIMVETPAAVMLSAQLANRADFFSIGSNDLTQYVLAMDRGNAGLAARVDACHPAVLHAIAQTASNAQKHGRWVGMCGGLASDPDAAPLLVGLGCDELSAVAGAVPVIKQRLRGWTRAGCQELARRALEQTSAGAVRALLGGDAR